MISFDLIFFKHFRTCYLNRVFPQEATDGIPDEQYIRNVIDILFRDNSKRLRPIYKYKNFFEKKVCSFSHLTLK